ncbi:MAG: adenylate/guanylate cyclase domain-containing protein [Actinomycetota bacterium]
MRRSDRVGGTATILVTDLVGSTAMFDRLGDERAEQVLRAHLGELRDLVRSFGGEEVKSTGDGVMAAFPAGWLATECAVAMQRTLHLANEEGAAVPLHVRIGIHSGDTTADRHDYYGIAVAVAARLCDRAPTDGILISDVTRGLVGSRGGHSYADAGVSELKGIDDPVRAWTLEWGPGQLPPAPPAGLEPGRGRVLGAAAATLLIVGVGAGMLLAGEDGPRRSGPPPPPGDLVRVSVRRGGGETSAESFSPAISGDGQTVVFASNSKKLLRTDDNGRITDIFHVRVAPLQSETLRIVSRRGPTQGNRASTQPSVSDDGNVVGFLSRSKNLAVKIDRNRVQDVFIHDLRTGLTTRASIGNEAQAANEESTEVDVSADGKFVAFTSAADNLSLRPDDNDKDDIFVHDVEQGRTNRVNIRSGNRKEANGNSFNPTLSGDGRYVAFASVATVLTPRDTNNSSDVFRFDRDPDEFKTVRASVTSEGQLTDGDSAHPSISDDGTRVAFVSEAFNLVEDDDAGADVFVHDFVTGQTILVSRAIEGSVAGAGRSANPAISGNGEYVVFDSAAGNLVGDDHNGVRDVFVYEIDTGKITRLSLGEDDEEAAADSLDPSISSDGSWVAFTSEAALVDDDFNGRADVYLRGPLLD